MGDGVGRGAEVMTVVLSRLVILGRSMSAEGEFSSLKTESETL